MLVATFAASLALASDPHRFVLQFQSDSDVASVSSIEASGTMIGDFDPGTNPECTQTRPGTSGGEGNHPIATDVVVGGEDDDSAIPEGSIRADVDLGTSTFEFTRFHVDLLREDILEVPLDSVRTFESFHTVNPDSIFPSGLEIEATSGDLVIDSMIATLGDAGGVVTLTPQLDNTWSLDGDVEFRVATGATFEGGPLDLPDAIVTATVTGSIVYDVPDETSSLILVIEIASLQSIDGDLLSLESESLEVPTVLPPGGIAHLLTDMTITSSMLESAISLTVFADGTTCLGDFNVDGVGDIFDVIDFLAALDDGAPDADWNADGIIDIFDALAFLGDFTAGGGC